MENIRIVDSLKGVNVEGVAFLSENVNWFSFAPNDPVSGQTHGFRCRGVAQQLSDGSFEFIAKPKGHPKSKLIRKLAHGRLSETMDGAVQLTLKVYKDEGVNISQVLLEEAILAAEAMRSPYPQTPPPSGGGE